MTLYRRKPETVEAAQLPPMCQDDGQARWEGGNPRLVQRPAGHARLAEPSSVSRNPGRQDVGRRE